MVWVGRNDTFVLSESRYVAYNSPRNTVVRSWDKFSV